MRLTFSIADLILKIVSKPCDGFTRKKNDLIYTVSVKLLDALMAKPIELKTLDGRVIKVTMDSIIKFPTDCFQAFLMLLAPKR